MSPLTPVAVAGAVTVAIVTVALVVVHIEFRLAQRRFARLDADIARRSEIQP